MQRRSWSTPAPSRTAFVGSVFVHAAVVGTAVLVGFGPPAETARRVTIAIRPPEEAADVPAPAEHLPEITLELPEEPIPLPKPIVDTLPPELHCFCVPDPPPPPEPTEPVEHEPETWSHVERVRPVVVVAESVAPAPSVASARVLEVVPGENPPPAYPALARRRGWEGSVLVRVWVDALGSVERFELASSCGHDVLDDAALTAARSWRFRNGPGCIEIPFEFVLR